MLSAPTAPRNPVKSFSGHFTQRGRNWWMQKWKKVEKVSHNVGQVCGDDSNHSKNHHVNRVPVMLGRENNCKSFVKISIIAQG